jgi:polyhydroxyalkanoate synthase
MARDGDARLKTVTLLTAQTDFTEPGELGLFIDESEVTYLEDMMWEQGYLDMQRDHVAPWRSVYKLHLLTDAEITFVVAGGGHNTGVVSEPGHPRGSYRVAKRVDGGKYVDPGAYLTAATQHEGSWWPEWQHWLVEHSGEKEVAPPTIGAPEQGLRPLGSAPGTYVLER